MTQPEPQKRGNLDARIDERLSGTSWNSAPRHKLAGALRAVLDECTAVSTKGDIGDGEFIAKRFRRIIARELEIEEGSR